MPAPPPSSLDEYRALFAGHGNTDEEYLARHWRRFRKTFALFSEQWSPEKSARVLDIGAHWLHQSVLYARAGYEVTAAEFGDVLQQGGVRSVAESSHIRLHGYDDLNEAGAFSALGPDSIDVVLFSEVLEHLAFNPVSFWQSVYEVLAPGGRIVLTTPNFYFWKTRVRGALRFAGGGGSGVSVDDVLKRPTYAHHWKEYSIRELKRYFHLLSPDFRMHRILCFSDRFAHVGPFGWAIYAEIDLRAKRRGIVVDTAWS